MKILKVSSCVFFCSFLP